MWSIARYFLNGKLVSDIVLDTSRIATDTIDYVATLPAGQAGDPIGLTATSTRTVLIEPAAPPSPAPQSIVAASTTIPALPPPAPSSTPQTASSSAQ